MREACIVYRWWSPSRPHCNTTYTHGDNTNCISQHHITVTSHPAINCGVTNHPCKHTQAHARTHIHMHKHMHLVWTVRVCMHACVRACVRACMRACVRACLCVCSACVRPKSSLLSAHSQPHQYPTLLWCEGAPFLAHCVVFGESHNSCSKTAEKKVTFAIVQVIPSKQPVHRRQDEVLR